MMNNQKTSLYLIIVLIMILVALVGWFVLKGGSNTRLFPTMPYSARQSFPSTQNEKAAISTRQPIQSTQIDQAAITIIAPVPGGNDPDAHDASGWQKIEGKIPVKVQAADDVSSIVFYLDRDIVGEVKGPPFGFELDTTKYTDCMYLLRAKAYDTKGNQLAEDRSQVWIDNTPANCM